MAHYYYKKYPYLNYDYRDANGATWTMFSIPPEMLVAAFIEKIGCPPKSFFDCGAATGEIVWRAMKIGLKANGIDIKQYPYQNPLLKSLFNGGHIKIKSIMDCEPIKSDIAYCNGTLTYFSENELPQVLNKFRDCKTLFAIHNTTEDVVAANRKGDILSTCQALRLVRPQEWWMETFRKNNFIPEYNIKLQCFMAIPIKQQQMELQLSLNPGHRLRQNER